MRVLELYCGIGGAAVALAGRGRVVAAVDLSRPVLAVYRQNFPTHPVVARNLETLTARDLRAWGADLWWLSPPCQPFTRRGKGADVDDPRCQSFLRLIDLLEREGPPAIALENVAPFDGSRAWQRLIAVLERGGYEIVQRVLCPSQLGVPNRRPRFYLVAARDQGLRQPRLAPRASRLRDHLRPAEVTAELTVDQELLTRYRGALHLVDADDDAAVTACFTSAYGRSPVRSGSYLRRGDRVRRFSPGEILGLLGFPRSFRLPPEVSTAAAWRMVGNSLSICAVEAMLTCLPELDRRPPAPRGGAEIGI